MITDGAGGKFPLVFNFRGKYQQKIRVPKGYPALVCHTKTAMSNGEFVIHLFERAIIPNLKPTEKYFVLLDEAPSHFSATVQGWMNKQENNTFDKIVCPLTK